MDTPKDLNSRIKILELFVLHVLPANNEWDYARSFVSNSDILDEERRDAFLQTLTELQEAKEQEAAEAAADQDLVGFAEETEDEDPQDDHDRIRMDEQDEDVIRDPINGDTVIHATPRKPSHHRTSSEVDYGIDDDLKARSPQPPSQPQPTATTKATSTTASTRTLSPTPSAPPPSTTSAQSRPSTSPPASKSHAPSAAVPARKQTPKSNSAKRTDRPTPISQLSKLIRIVSSITSTMYTSLTRNPTQVFRTVMFLFAFLAVLARRDVRERLKRIVNTGWVKVMQTAGMGVKVSYV